ncbi:DmpA family aminopeptidase [Bacillus seohaeanensis]|jgi:D-aminopeptidase|uniref:P1 family peptidase n=1 Tax=Bacillus seohaeanensis TaxID=284580 RepID=A0ABW5RL28_9BACI
MVLTRKRLRELGKSIGKYKTGEYNSITDVEGVKVGHCTLREDRDDTTIRTGVTAILPHSGNLFREKVFASSHVINGFGKTAGTIQINELGLLESPIMLTNTLSVGDVLQGTVQYMLEKTPEIGDTAGTVNAVVGECNDGYLNDIRGLHVGREHVKKAIESAKSGVVEEGCVGAGTGMLCLGFKGGVGTSSRIHLFGQEKYTVGALVVTNFGQRKDLRIPTVSDETSEKQLPDGSIMIILATDAPLNDRQLERLAKRASFGLSRTGSYATHGSGDIVISFSTAHKVPHQPSTNENTMSYNFLREDGKYISQLFEMTVDTVEEAIWNSLCKAETITGRKGRTVEAFPYELLDDWNFFNEVRKK